MPSMTRRLALALFAGTATYGAMWYYKRNRGRSKAQALYANPLTPPQGALNVFHLGHSLVRSLRREAASSFIHWFS